MGGWGCVVVVEVEVDVEVEPSGQVANVAAFRTPPPR